jgi:hypothetical protein
MVSIPSPMSLPPNVSGETRGHISISTTRMVWNQQWQKLIFRLSNVENVENIIENAVVRVKWWGDDRGLGTVVLHPLNNVNNVGSTPKVSI